jgi:hypothetical protein
MEDQALKDYFHFDEGDLQANRNGQLSDKQRLTLLADQKSGRRFGLVAGLGCGVGLLAIASIFPLVFIPIGLTTLREDGAGAAIAPFIAAIAWALIWGVIGCVAIVSGVSGAIGKPAPLTVQSVTGPVNLVGVERTSGGKHHHTYIQHELHVGDQEFDVASSLAGHIMQGDTYAIYYLDDDSVLSLERLAAAWPA